MKEQKRNRTDIDRISKQELSIKSLPAKSLPFQSVYTHSLVAGIVAVEITKSYISEGIRERLSSALDLDQYDMSCFVGYLAAMHDVGKLAPAFAASIVEACSDRDVLRVSLSRAGLRPVNEPRRRICHEDSSRRIMYRLWGAHGEDIGDRMLFSDILGAHHQGKTERSDCDELPKATPWEDHWRELNSTMLAYFNWKGKDRKLLPRVNRTDMAFVSAILNGIVILADWIASGEWFADAETIAASEDTGKLRDMARDFLHRSELEAQIVEWETAFEDLWPDLPGPPRPLQRTVESLFRDAAQQPQLLIIEAPMGEGKTEAAIYAALQMARGNRNGLYMALPTAATANQMVGRVRRFLHNHDVQDSVRLLHSRAWLTETPSFNLTDDADAAERWLDPLRRGLLGSYAVGTVDQALMAAMFIKYGVLRLLGLSNKVLIVDEVHAYDVYMETILCRLLEWCRALEIPVVLLSATLPASKKQDLLRPYTDQSSVNQVYPAITAVYGNGELKVVQVTGTAIKGNVGIETIPILRDSNKIAEKAIQLTEDGGNLCIIMNTVQQAQDVYKAIKERWDSPDLHLFHARFPMQRRNEIEKQCLELFGPRNPESEDQRPRPNRSILVATQVVEQSLDIDVDVMMTAIAPVDLVLQRMGRMHRHSGIDRSPSHSQPVLYVLTPEDEVFNPDTGVYPECLLRQSAHIFGETERVCVPDDIPSLVERGYDSKDVSPEEIEKWLEKTVDDTIAKQEGRKYILESPSKGFEVVMARDPHLDDMEKHGFVAAHTRLQTSPTVTIALLEPELFAQAKASCESREKRPSVALAKSVTKHSVSVPAKRMEGFESYIEGNGRLFGIQMYPAKGGVYTEGENTIRYDPDLGVVWDEV